VNDSLDIEQPEALRHYLRGTLRIAEDEDPSFKILHGGVSNRTVLVRRPSGEAWVIKQALAKLRVKEDWFSDPVRVHREALGLRWLEQLAPPGTITPLVFEDEEHHLLAMQAVPEPHENWKSMLLGGRVGFDHVAQFAELLGAVHHRAAERRAEIEPVFAERGFFETLRLEPYYRFTARRHPGAARFFERLVADTLAARVTLVHGDFSPKNILVHRDRLVLLDHEVIHWGDPAFDLGFSLTHLLSKAHHLPLHRADLIEAARCHWQCYRSGAEAVAEAPGLEERAVRHTLACLLARVDGRSPLEYLSEGERSGQRRVVLDLMSEPPTRMARLFDAFSRALGP
jgi:5-methylthioribose kinase